MPYSDKEKGKKLAAERVRVFRKSRAKGHSRHVENAEYGIEASRRRKLARIAEQLQIVTAYHASDRKIPRPACIPTGGD